MTAKEKLLFLSSFIWVLHWGTCLSIYHSGYGYSQNHRVRMLPHWFLNEYFPRHKIDVEIDTQRTET